MEYFVLDDIYPLCLSSMFVAIFLINDIRKGQKRIPNAILFTAFLLAIFIYQSRNSETWLSFGKFVVIEHQLLYFKLTLVIWL